MYHYTLRPIHDASVSMYVSLYCHLRNKRKCMTDDPINHQQLQADATHVNLNLNVNLMEYYTSKRHQMNLM